MPDKRIKNTDVTHTTHSETTYSSLATYTFNQTHINTHINPFYSFSKRQSFVESVDVDSVRWSYLHKWLL